MGGRADLRPERADSRPERQISGLRGPGGDERTNGRTNGMTNESPPVFHRTSSPSGPLPCFFSLYITIMQSRATGIADHILPLGDLLLFNGNLRSERLDLRPKRLE